MGVTYITARERDRRRGGLATPDAAGERLLAVVMFVAALLVGLGYLGRSAAFEWTEGERGLQTPVDLTRTASTATLEPVVAAVFENAIERRFVARRMYDAIAAPDAPAVSNVGSLARIAVSVADIDRLPAGSVLGARLQAVRATALAGERPAPTSIPLLTSAEIAALKPALAVRSMSAWRSTVAWSALALFAVFAAAAATWRLLGRRGDHVLLASALLLTALGFVVMLSRPDPLRDTMLVVRFTQGVAIGVVGFLLTSLLDVRRLSHLGLTYLPLATALVAAVSLVLFGTGPGGSGTRINLGPVQPVEAIRFFIVLFLAGYFARRWELLREVRATSVRDVRLPGWLNVPRADHVLPVAAGVAVALLLFFALKDLGPALLVSLVFLAMFGVAHGRPGLVAAGFAALLGGFYLGHALGVSATLTERVAMWLAPWENAVRGGDQLAQAAWALASGGPLGTAAGLGATRYIPAGHTDLALASLAEELGVAGIAAALAAFGVIAWRGLRIARTASTDYGSFLALGMTLSFAAPVLVMVAGILGVIPLTGVVTPFVSYGGSAMVMNFVVLGLIAACRSVNDEPPAVHPFALPLRWLTTTLVIAAVGLAAAWMRVQVVSADVFVARPQLSQQADGGLRYQYNPRVLDASQRIPRGSIFDRDGLPLAARAGAVTDADREAYRRIGIDVGKVCAASDERCYPLGGAAFHVLGDARSRLNWAAGNSSYVERDAEGLLRGFDDHAEIVRRNVPGRGGSTALKRDYTALVPLVRHQWEPQHPDVVELLGRPRDVRLTIDARLQHEVARILERAVRTAGVSEGAAVVLDAETGDVLASVSYPWPGVQRPGPTVPDTTFDRARYGVYPPGSTFKLVTAAAALRANPSLVSVPLQCSRLPDNRVGVRIPGWGRPIRDDIHDHSPHGSIAMREAVVRSCNAYFAQLAVRLGEDALAETAGAAGIALAPSNDPRRLRDNLPHAGYGQGQVLATPLRMARVAAALGTDGAIREAPLVGAAGTTVSTQFVPAASAGILASAMREAVTAGTGRQLAGHPGRIAGKTGTAEVDEFDPHAWFVGFAPYGSATKRIAFAVVLEHAGYGGATAAAATGQIVTAATTLGLVR